MRCEPIGINFPARLVTFEVVMVARAEVEMDAGLDPTAQDGSESTQSCDNKKDDDPDSHEMVLRRKSYHLPKRE